MTVLILAPDLDITADRVVAALTRRGTRVARMDTAWFPRQAKLSARLHSGRWKGELDTGTRTVNLEEVRSVWYRNPNAFDPPDGMSETERNWAMNEAKLGFGGVLASLPVLWVNHPSRAADAAYKPTQLITAASCGLTVPDTLITNQPDAVRQFADAGATVSKALGAPAVREATGRSVAFTRLLDDEALADLAGLEHTSHQIQRWVPKLFEARVTVVGRRHFATGIYATGQRARVDWRADYRSLGYSTIVPPTSVTTGIRRYLSATGLSYGAFDFVVRPDGSWVFLECNPGGQYGWLEDRTNVPITDALADLLSQGNN
ncbi:ATP-grasp ribosomal peptide maturase [Tamaricihabitans halophyticus]|uniref:ATP-grasp ribosomal peptide maturase n=1 Tax=Tamaricihabitans halophyticus TaxID=1262583 RepID=A0A4R2QYV9_9PSEU|nr:ATP-grasp ribosomal peptide maturase [Tamaricihabitans halophyticus]TCP54877.1 ATP-grasp ribosomal peptide maturase [Tamaricihabitans halophyticus]